MRPSVVRLTRRLPAATARRGRQKNNHLQYAASKIIIQPFYGAALAAFLRLQRLIAP
jgi:hypothetical protein